LNAAKGLLKFRAIKILLLILIAIEKIKKGSIIRKLIKKGQT
jgi:hypothetical protein